MVGMSEAEAAMRAGGSARTAAETHKLDVDQFASVLTDRLDRMLENGTTTVEAAAGYSIDFEAELDLLEVAAMVDRRQPVDLVRTFDVVDLPLVPSDRPETIQHLIHEVLPAMGDVVDAVRIWAGKDAMSVYEAHDLFLAANQLGYRTRMHTGASTPGELQQLAIDVSVATIDHCGSVDPARMMALAAAGTAAVITPTSWMANREELPNLQELIAGGVAVALGTDCSPAPVMVESLPLAISMAVLELGLTPDQAVWSATRGSAIALDLTDKGWIGYGALADVVILDGDSPAHLAYRPGSDVIWKVFKQGVPVA